MCEIEDRSIQDGAASFVAGYKLFVDGGAMAV